MKSLLTLLIASSICCPAVAADIMQKAKVTHDLAYDSKDDLQTLDVVKPPHVNGAGIVCFASGACIRASNRPKPPWRPGHRIPTSAGSCAGACSIRDLSFFLCGTAVAKSTSCPK